MPWQIFEDSRERSVLQPHYNYMRKVTIPYSNTRQPEDGVCTHFLKKGIIKGGDRGLVKMTSACWSNGGRRLVCGLENGYYGLWENEQFKFYKPIGVHVHMERGNVYMPIHVAVYLSIHLSAYLYAYLYIYVPIYLLINDRHSIS